MKDFLNQIKDFFDGNEKGKMILFFCVYLIFFAVLILMIHLYGDRNYWLQEYEEGYSDFYDNEAILNSNFVYDYKVTIDGVVYDYYGKRLGDIESFKYNNQDYYDDSNSFFVNQGIWVKTENPYLFYEFFQTKNMISILEQATYDSTISYEDKGNEYHYYISSNTLNDILYHQNTDYDEIPNEITISVDQDRQLTKIVYQLDSFCSIIDSCENSLVIEVAYDLFGSIKKIDNPIE